MADKWTCLTCYKEFGVGKWTCVDGVANHVVAEKVYRVCDAPAEPGRPADGTALPVVRGRTTVCNIPPPRKVMEGGEVKMIGEGSVEFINGRFSTSDPEKQYWLDKKPGYGSTEEQWKRNWYSKDELLADKEAQLNSAQMRLEADRNDLLAQTKQRVGA